MGNFLYGKIEIILPLNWGRENNLIVHHIILFAGEGELCEPDLCCDRGAAPRLQPSLRRCTGT